jgi:hypothetical protein
MAKKCALCTHPSRIEIESLITQNELSDREIALKYNLNNLMVVFHHRKNHLGANLKRINEKIKQKVDEKAIEKELADLEKKNIVELMDPFRRLAEGIRHIKIVADKADTEKGCSGCKLHLLVAEKYFDSVKLEQDVRKRTTPDDIIAILSEHSDILDIVMASLMHDPRIAKLILEIARSEACRDTMMRAMRDE